MSNARTTQLVRWLRQLRHRTFGRYKIYTSLRRIEFDKQDAGVSCSNSLCAGRVYLVVVGDHGCGASARQHGEYALHDAKADG